LIGELAVDAALERAWRACAPATWNRHVATARSFVAFCRRRCWMGGDVAVGVERRREPAERTRAIPYAALERLWRRDDVALREKALWRLLYETATTRNPEANTERRQLPKPCPPRLQPRASGRALCKLKTAYLQGEFNRA